MAKSEPLSLSLPNLEELPGTAVMSVGRCTVNGCALSRCPFHLRVPQEDLLCAQCLQPYYFTTLSSSVLSTDCKSDTLLGTPAT